MWPFTSLCQALRNCHKNKAGKNKTLVIWRVGVGKRRDFHHLLSPQLPSFHMFFFLISFHDLCSWLSWSLEQATFNTVAVLAPCLTPNLEDREITPCRVCTTAVWSLLTLALGVTEWEMYIPPPLGKVAIPWRQKEKDSIISYNLGSI